MSGTALSDQYLERWSEENDTLRGQIRIAQKCERLSLHDWVAVLGMSRATYYRKLANPDLFTLKELRTVDRILRKHSLQLRIRLWMEEVDL